MKKLFIILIAAFVALPAFSQFNVGVKAGLSTTSITMDDIKSVTSSTASYTVQKLEGAKYGFHGGLFARLKVWMIYVQPELLFSTRTNAYTVTNVNTTVAKDVTQNLSKLDIPVMVGLKIGPLRVNAGPSGSLLIGKPKDLIDDPNLKSMYANMTVGYQAGVGLDIFKKLTFDVRYEGSLKKYQTQIENMTGTTFNLDDRPNAFLFSLGLMF
jgi:hypothetical protein